MHLFINGLNSDLYSIHMTFVGNNFNEVINFLEKMEG